MNWLIEHKLRRLGAKADPDRAFVKRLENRLIQESGLVKPSFSPVLRWAAVASLIVLVGGGATSAYAYESEGILPGDTLYPLKLEVEGLVEKAAWKSSWKAEIELDHLKRRLKEDVLTVKRDGHLPDKRLEAFHAQLEKSIDKVSELSDADHPKLDGMAADLAENYSDLLDNPASTTADLAQKEQKKLKDKVEKLDDHRRKVYEKVRLKIENREAREKVNQQKDDRQDEK